MSHIPRRLDIGKFEISETCAVPWEEMDMHTGGNRLCRQCDKVVHDLTGMSEREIEVLFHRNGGMLCGNFSLDAAGNPIYFKQQSAPKKVRFLKHWAAAASIFLLYQTPQAGGHHTGTATSIASPPLFQGDAPALLPSIITPKTNTLLSGVILTQDSSEIRDTLQVDVFAKGNQVASLQAENGFFHHDFADTLLPTDSVTIVVQARVVNPENVWNKREYKGTTYQTTLGNAQNVTVTVAFKHPERKMGGVMMPRRISK
jgi:hypothetical protein